MSVWSRPPLGIAAIAVSCLVLTGGSSAAIISDRYASPSGSGSACTQSSPCKLPVAVSGALSGADVWVTGNRGPYHLNAELDTNPGVAVHIHGVNGRPRLIFADGGLRLQTGTLDGVSVEGHSGSTTLGLDTSAARADRVIARAAGDGHACFMQGATMTNSVCWAGKSGDLGLETDGSNTLRNVTIVGGTEAAVKAIGRASCACPVATDTLVNVIARSKAGGVDLLAESDGAVAANINVSHSNFATTQRAGTTSMAHINSGAGNEKAAPKFINAAAGNFHEAASSPTIDAGITSPANGKVDLDGKARVQHGKTDIGALEASPRPNTKITKAKIKAGKHRATFRFRAVGKATGLQCKLVKPKVAHRKRPKAAFRRCTSPKTYRGLKPGRYTFRVRAVNASGADPTPATRRFRIKKA